MAQADALAAQAAADLVLYQAGFADGVASVPAAGGGISSAQEQADIQAAVAVAIQPLNDQISAMNLVKQQEDALLASVKALASQLLSSLG